MPLDRKTPPPVDAGKFHPDCFALWKKATVLRSDHMNTSFIGVTLIEPRTIGAVADAYWFFMYACFGYLADPNLVFPSLGMGEPKKFTKQSRENEFSGRVIFVDCNGLPGLPGSQGFDGKSHGELIKKLSQDYPGLGIAEDKVIGWGIRPMSNGAFLVRFSSGRNTPKFEPRSEGLRTGESESDHQNRLTRHAVREKRDLPKNWARWVRDVINRELAITFIDDAQLMAVQDAATPAGGRSYRQVASSGSYAKVAVGFRTG